MLGERVACQQPVDEPLVLVGRAVAAARVTPNCLNPASISRSIVALKSSARAAATVVQHANQAKATSARRPSEETGGDIANNRTGWNGRRETAGLGRGGTRSTGYR
jgi:hypothetical protein